MYRKSGLTLKKYLRVFWETSPVYTVCAVQCFLIFWNGFQSVESKTGTLLMYRAGGLQAGGSFLSYFVTWQRNITRQMKETAMSGIRTLDVNNSDSGPWNIWCRNLIYFKSPTVLRLSSTKQWNFKLRSELKVTVTEEHFVFSDQLCVWPGASDQWPSHECLRWSLGVITQVPCHHPLSPLVTDTLQSPATQSVISSNRQILRPHERSAHVNHRISNPLKMPIKL